MRNYFYTVIVLFFLTLSFYSCNTDDSSIPESPVNIYLNLSTTYLTFKSPLQYHIFEKRDDVAAVYAVGYAGVIVNMNYDARYCAFDMCCPYEKSKTVKVYPDNSGINAICEECGSEFDLAFGLGQVRKGPAKENLKHYNTSVYPSKGSDILRIHN